MSKFYSYLTPTLEEFIQKQKIFFTATAPPKGRINLSPKGMDTFRCIDQETVAYLDLTGSGNETAAHLEENDRITLMFCSFSEEALILRLYGKGQSIRPRHQNWESLASLFPSMAGTRQIILININSIQTSCGYGVPLYDFREERKKLVSWAEQKGEKAIQDYWELKNQKSIDGLPTYLLEKKMRKSLKLFILALTLIVFYPIVILAQSEQVLYLAYPPNNHQTVAEKIFFIGSASPTHKVTINNQPIQRSKTGNFAPSFPLKIGENKFTIHSDKQTIQRNITRLSNQSEIPKNAKFDPDSLTPNQNITRLAGEKICFSAIAPKNAQVFVKIGDQNLALFPQSKSAQLLPNSAVLTASNQPKLSQNITQYQGCTSFTVGNLGKPIYTINVNNQTVNQTANGEIEIIATSQVSVVETISDIGTTRTGPSTDYSRLTPLPKGTKASVTGTEGDWLRLDYGAWILAKETQLIPDSIPIQSIVKGISSRRVENATEIIFPLENPVPIEIKQEDNKFILTLYNTTAQTDTIYLVENPLIKRLDWQQVNPQKIEYTFHLNSTQQWGHDVRYEGTSLILSLHHSPQLQNKLTKSLAGVSILLDPGHGGKETGSVGPTGYTEKEINLVFSKLLKEELIKRGVTVYLTRETDQELSLNDRVAMINQIKPTLSISIHYNALPDGGDALNTDGIGAFWYHPQAHDLAVFLHNYLTKTLNRPSYGVYWNNLALTRPHTAPSILLELGFMINPTEFEWIINPQEQVKLANAIADGITKWLDQVQP